MTKTDPLYQDMAKNNAKRGYPWAVWGAVDGNPLVLMDSKATQAEAEQSATELRAIPLYKRNGYVFTIRNEA